MILWSIPRRPRTRTPVFASFLAAQCWAVDTKEGYFTTNDWRDVLPTIDIPALIVVGLAHPVGFDDGLGQHDQMISYTEALTAAKVRGALARTVLFEHRVDVVFNDRFLADNGASISVADATILTAALLRHPTISAIDRRCQTQRYFRSCH